MRASSSFLALGRTCLVALLAGLVLAPLSRGQDPAPTFEQGFALLQQADVDGAIAVLRQVTENEPEHGRAWAILGYALHSQGKLDEAIPCHETAAGIAETAALGAYNAGMAWALKGDADKAFGWLTVAKDAGTMDMSVLDNDPDAASLKSDPRWKTLRPGAPDWDDPFVEPARIIHEWDGEAPGGEFGWIARNIGDVDGDGVNDLVTSAQSLAVAGPASGRVYVYSGKGGELLWNATGQPGDNLGSGIEAAGDVDGDGIPDVVGGAPGGDYVKVWSGDDGRELLHLTGSQRGASFGRKVSDLGDVNGDGHGDVFVGAPRDDEGGNDAGKAYVFSGKDGALLHTWIGQGAGYRLGAAGAGAVFGDELLVVIGAPDAGRTQAGRTYVYDGLTATPFFRIESDTNGGELGGMFVSVVGDVDADGTPDVYASDWSFGTDGRGRVYIHSGADGTRLMTLMGSHPGEGLGIGPADAGDVDGDGHDDLIVGAWQHATAAPSGGKVTLFSGKDGAELATWTGKIAGETFGFDATGMGDVDGDGGIDFLLTSAWSGKGGTKTGRMYVVAGPVFGER
jgi:hypothetical protein